MSGGGEAGEEEELPFIPVNRKSKNKRMRSAGAKKDGEPSEPIVEEWCRFPVRVRDLGTGTTHIRNHGTQQKHICECAGVAPSEISLRNIGYNMWIVSCPNGRAQKKLAGRTVIGGAHVECTIPSPRVVGVVHGIPLHESASAISASLRNQGIQATASRLTNRDGSNSKAIKIEIQNETKLPTRLKVGALLLPLEPFAPSAVHCKNCCRLGHTARACRFKFSTCVRCGSRGHARADCPATVAAKCVNCGGPHSAAYQKCPRIILLREANKIRNQNYIPYPEAIRRAKLNINNKEAAGRNGDTNSSLNLDSSAWAKPTIRPPLLNQSRPPMVQHQNKKVAPPSAVGTTQSVEKLKQKQGPTTTLKAKIQKVPSSNLAGPVVQEEKSAGSKPTKKKKSPEKKKGTPCPQDVPKSQKKLTYEADGNSYWSKLSPLRIHMLKEIQVNMDGMLEVVQTGNFESLLIAILKFNRLITTMLISLQDDPVNSLEREENIDMDSSLHVWG